MTFSSFDGRPAIRQCLAGQVGDLARRSQRPRPIAGNSTRGVRGAERDHAAEKTKPPGTSAALAFPCERADRLEVSCWER